MAAAACLLIEPPFSAPAMRTAPIALLLVLAACGPSEPAPAEPTAPGATAAAGDTPPSVADTVVLTTDDRVLSERPTAPVRVTGACPFEGCVYGTWTTSAETTVYATAGDSTSTAFTVPAGTTLEASEGFVLLTRLGETVVERPAELFLAPEETVPLAAGDTLLVLDYEGEGSHRVWYDGRIGFSEAGALPGPPGDGPMFRSVVAPVQQWWARVTTPDGRTGWLWMDRTPGVTGADALAG